MRLGVRLPGVAGLLAQGSLIGRGIPAPPSDYLWMEPAASTWESQDVPTERSPSEPPRGCEEHWPTVFRYAYSRLRGNREVALDVTQETFASALSAQDLPARTIMSDEAWLISIARRRIADHFRHQFRQVSATAAMASAPVVRDSNDEAELRVDLLRALDDLPRHHSEVLMMKYVCDLPVAEVAHILELTTKAVEGRLSRARQALQERLQQMEFE